MAEDPARKSPGQAGRARTVFDRGQRRLRHRLQGAELRHPHVSRPRASLILCSRLSCEPHGAVEGDGRARASKPALRLQGTPLARARPNRHAEAHCQDRGSGLHRAPGCLKRSVRHESFGLALETNAATAATQARLDQGVAAEALAKERGGHGIPNQIAHRLGHSAQQRGGYQTRVV
ncbi:unnamed protein product [Prorocentrum cordatum]|uniref:Uncharacterized protein n=1 Tax=Prorocentrum cordatum TaxID=2364126 RepID=A0ABN9S3A4_9DINO|nr:unnamed protein product [Polarella glacialis]